MGSECSNHFAPTKINHLGEGKKRLSKIAPELSKIPIS